MDLKYSPADDAFRADIRLWLDANLPRALRDKVLNHKRLNRDDYASWSVRFVGQQPVHLHGGMGVTNELPVAHWFERLSIIETTLGDGDHHLARLASLPAFIFADA